MQHARERPLPCVASSRFWRSASARCATRCTSCPTRPRTISTSINIIWVAKAFERIGDHAKNIAEQVIYIVKGRDVRHTPLAEVEREALG